tara:strand:- start:85 stop:378 length:294 start_codon:yes stop_codon:yes gene_type:complete
MNINPMNNPEFLAAVNGSTVRGVTCGIEFDGFLMWNVGGGMYATPQWEGAQGIAVSIDCGDTTHVDTIPVDWTGDGAVDAVRYVSAMRRWLRDCWKL